MAKARNTFLGVLFFVLGLFFFAMAADEKITITTYYPSPYGSYKDLQITKDLITGTTSQIDGWITTDITGQNKGMAATDAAIFIPVWANDTGVSAVDPYQSEGTMSDFRLYIMDDATDRFSIWGGAANSYGTGINSAINIATFVGNGTVGVNVQDPTAALDIWPRWAGWNALRVRGNSQFDGSVTISGALNVAGNLNASTCVSYTTGTTVQCPVNSYAVACGSGSCASMGALASPATCPQDGYMICVKHTG